MARTKQTARASQPRFRLPSEVMLKNAIIAWTDFYGLAPDDEEAVRIQLLQQNGWYVYCWMREFKRIMCAKSKKPCLLSRKLPIEIIDRIVELLNSE